MNKLDKILLSILPYWDPMIPPNGIAHLKSFLQKHGFQVKTVDVIIEETFQNSYKNYFQQRYEYNTDLFARETMEGMAKRYRELLETILENPNPVISTLRLKQRIHSPGIRRISRNA